MYGLEKFGPAAIAVAHGTGPATGFTSFVFQNTLGTNPQKVALSLHNCDPTVPVAGDPQRFVQVFIVAGDVSTVPPESEIMNVGLVTTETYFPPIILVLYPGECLLIKADQTSPPYAYLCTYYGTVDTII